MNDLSDMIKEQKQCFQKPDKYQFQCAFKVLEKYTRKNKFIKNFIYPWTNYDWSYIDFVEKNYEPTKLGASSRGSVENLMRDIEILIKIIDALVSSPNPNSKSKAKNPNINTNDNDLVPCKVSNKQINEIANIKNEISNLRDISNDTSNKFEKSVIQTKILELVGKTQQFITSCAVLNSISAQGIKQKKPYPDKFFKNLDGEKSSSFYAMIGSCPTSIDNKSDCEKKGYNWIPNPLFNKPENEKGVNTKSGSCFKGRYAYIDNTPGLNIGQIKSLKGLVPSIIKNITEFSPDKLVFAASGFGIPGLEIQQCEPFISGSLSTSNWVKCSLSTSNWVKCSLSTSNWVKCILPIFLFIILLILVILNL